MKITRSLALASIIATIPAICGDYLILLVVNALRAGTRLQQAPMIMLTIGGLLGCLFLPLAYGLGFAAMARVLRPTAKIMAAVILFCGIVAAIVGPTVHWMTWMEIRSAVITGAISSSPPMEAVVEGGGILLDLWIIGGVLLLVFSILVMWSGIRQPRVIPLWLALLNPIILNLVISALGSFSAVGRSYLVPMATNLAHLGFCLALFWCLLSGKVQQPPVPSYQDEKGAVATS